ncbi:MAG: hypothetical protein DME22_05515 [Verrucomicrobia bacterium]|nr:MAG: hypothetical protein DME22_05515 [Verrucomicrobiota bacterium]PYK00143.1 MAG: hypothetical protein DME23_08060 [Verrucomicrobiota bacterium]
MSARLHHKMRKAFPTGARWYRKMRKAFPKIAPQLQRLEELEKLNREIKRVCRAIEVKNRIERLQFEKQGRESRRHFERGFERRGGPPKSRAKPR